MADTMSKEGKTKVYEIGYLLVSSIPGEKVADTVASLQDVLTKKGAVMIADEAPELQPLSYTMTKKIGSQHHRFDQAYFGWMKFELSTAEIESVKKAFELNPEMLRMLVVITVPENTYLGKKTPVAAALKIEDVLGEAPAPVEVAPVATAEDMDKSIDEMVKGA